ncbi:hypothetical protein HRbin40_00765 [bacterium HR40]|nr:hypothetical protein HRbin40_00765 [bacterium HR40]
MLAAFPLLTLVVVLYNLAVLLSGGPPDGVALVVDMVSGASLLLTWGELVQILGLVLLYVEMVKATRTAASSIADHLLSTLLFVICLLELVSLPAFATGTFLLLTLMTLFDLVAGFTVTITAARRDIAVGDRELP